MAAEVAAVADKLPAGVGTGAAVGGIAGPPGRLIPARGSRGPVAGPPDRGSRLL